MSLGVIALLLAGAAAGWLLLRLVKGDAPGGDHRTMTILKAVVWLGLVAGLFAARLMPLAFMVLLAAGSVMAIEIWKDRAIKSSEGAVDAPAGAKNVMTIKEAAAILGVEPGASGVEITTAYKKIITQLHPDKGGTNYLASKINEARDLMIKHAPANLSSDAPDR